MDGPWTADSVAALRRAALKYPRSIEKNERWRLIAKEVNRGKRECYQKWKDEKKKSTCKKERLDLLDVSEWSESKIQKSNNVQEQHCQGIGDEEKGDSLQVEDFDDDNFFDFDDDCAGQRRVPRIARLQAAGDSRQHRMIDLDSVLEIKNLLFGKRKPGILDASWQKQGFFFQKRADLKFGLVQLQGGPCGVIAAVQACVLRHLLFEKHIRSSSWANPSREAQRQALSSALCDIIWQAATHDKSAPSAFVCVYTGDRTGPASVQAKDYRPDGFLDRMQVVGPLNSHGSVLHAIEEHLDAFMAKAGPGVGMLVVSLILSRGVANVRNDFDTALGSDNSSLIGSHNYASQELVNLLLVGYACSNVFNGTRLLGDEKSDALHGIQSRSQVGFLTLYEHYEYLQVGDSLKTPHVPVWVVCSESHYSVLFATRVQCLGALHLCGEFDLFYYDELGNQEEVYRLTVNPDPEVPVEHDTSSNRLVSPIDDCIRTRWKGATVCWNGSEPLL